MNRYVLTPAAEDDLNDIWEYIAEDSVDSADRVIGEIFEAVAALAAFPGMGHRREDLASEALRVWPVHSYLVVYRPEQKPLEIVRVVSGFRDLFPLFASE